ncbi:ATPase [Aliifodinibius salipaludis]|uniref:ATPase n=1 Tax=Fodinibius salipaludis TaxID=2032627 RepID=A0A2A2GBR1_9BACT|nr:ATP cone domain-containing protein [Aliifodinibius salipaludis]PAU94275.1 ATPase [Aliifodinibius salipaludis]
MVPITVTKASGEKEPFDENKLRRSLNSAGADQQIIDRIANAISGILYDGISTQEIYKRAFRLLRQYSDRSAGRYKLKEALLELGPTGYPFEKFVGELLKRLGYHTETGIVVEGNCVSHEIDVIAEKDDKHFMIECKFHNRKGHTCNVKVPLYIQSRFQDVERNWSNQSGHEDKQHQGWVVTNTRFTKDALQYGNCIGLKLLSWDYPQNNGLKDLISQVNLHPVTCLSTLSKKDKQQLLQQNVIFCQQLCENDKILTSIGLDNRKKNQVLKEAQDICNVNKY